MKKVFTIISILFWLAVGAAAVLTWDAGTDRMAGLAPSAPGVAYAGALFMVFLIGIFINSLVLDFMFAQKKEGDKSGAESEARKALKAGNYRLAIVHYENAGELEKALELAREHRDRAQMAKLQLKLGRKRSALECYVDVEDFQSAGNICISLGDLAEARQYYLKAAEHQKEFGDQFEVAQLFDRAQEYERAAELYEYAKKYDRASEAYRLLGDFDKADSNRVHYEQVKTYERDHGMARNRESRDNSVLAQRATKALEQNGDLYGAAWGYRAADDFKAAALCYERLEEWERAVICWEKAGDRKRADELRPRIPPKKPIVRKPPAGAQIQYIPMVAPDPKDLPPELFVPLAQKALEMLPQKILELTQQSLMQDKTAPSQWRDLARQLESKGHHVEAAELYMRLGEVDDAVRCLANNAKPLDAALMALQVGDYPMAVERLVEGLEFKNDPALGLLLGEIIMKLGDMELAEKVFRRRLVPIVSKDTAPFAYRYARLFEDAGDNERAHRIYGMLIDSGADSVELDARFHETFLKLESDRRPTNEEIDISAVTGGTAGETAPATGLPPEAQAIGAAQKFIGAHDTNSSEFENLHERGTRIHYPFEVPNHRTYLDALGVRTTHSPASSDTLPKGEARATSLALPSEPDNEFSPVRRYEIVGELGQGGMGVVYEARDSVLDRRIALKVLTSLDKSRENIKQFLLEARAIAQLNHPNVITIYDIGLLEGRHYIAMEYIEGNDVKKYIRDTERLPVKEALRIFIEMSEGLHAIHEAGIVHRDIKPANVLLTAERQAKIVDFGLAKIKTVGLSGEDLFRSAGTPGFMPPEQIQGANLTPATDIYALGITLFTMLTGFAPHHPMRFRKPMDIFQWTIQGKLPTIREYRQEVPEEIDDLFAYCTAANPTDRYQSVGTFLEVAKQWYRTSENIGATEGDFLLPH